MTADDTKFSHITVEDDDDEFVIQAGARSASPHAQAGDVQVAEQPAAPVAAPQPAAKPEKQRDKEYRATTAEDLESVPMSVTQKVVIAAAALLIVGFAVYFMFFMR